MLLDTHITLHKLGRAGRLINNICHISIHSYQPLIWTLFMSQQIDFNGSNIELTACDQILLVGNKEAITFTLIDYSSVWWKNRTKKYFAEQEVEDKLHCYKNKESDISSVSALHRVRECGANLWAACEVGIHAFIISRRDLVNGITRWC